MLKDLYIQALSLADPKRAKSSLWFFKTGKGEYGEGDKFLGLSNPICRQLAKKYRHLSLAEINQLLQSQYHEHRLIALVILQLKFEQADQKAQKQIYDFYISHTLTVNNWDLVDISAPKIVGAYLSDKPRSVLYRFAKSKNLWQRRISIISCLYFVGRQKDPVDAIKISQILLTDKHDLIHKAVGWTLREIGKHCGQKHLTDFLDIYTLKMPRTMLRYAIERLPEDKKKHYLKLR